MTDEKRGVFGDYVSSGVDYSKMDPFKRAALQRAQATVPNLIGQRGFRVVEGSYGESAFLVETPEFILAHVLEGLGTKNVVAEAMYRLTGKPYYHAVGQCNAAMIINDLITTGAMPVSIMLYVAAGNSDWFKDELAALDLVKGFGDACDLADVVWGGGETPTLRDIIAPGTVDLAGSATGIIAPKHNKVESRWIRHGDSIILIKSSGVHANGITKIRDVAAALPKGYLTEMPGTAVVFGEAVLAPTIIYKKLVGQCLAKGVDLHYIVNITGHGWRKLMRPVESWAYFIDRICTPQPEFRVIQEVTGMTDRQMYGDYNMGAGFALYVAPEHADKTISIAQRTGYEALCAGYVEKPADGKKRVCIRPLGIEYSEEELQVR